MRAMLRIVTAGLVLMTGIVGGAPTGWAPEAAHYVEDHYDVPFVHDCHGFRPHHDECR